MTAKVVHRASPRKPAPKFTEDDKVLQFISLDELTTPKTGSVVVCNQYWIMHPTKGAVIFRRHFPQRNTARNIAETVRDLAYPWAEVNFIGIAYIPTRHQDNRYHE